MEGKIELGGSYRRLRLFARRPEKMRFGRNSLALASGTPSLRSAWQVILRSRSTRQTVGRGLIRNERHIRRLTDFTHIHALQSATRRIAGGTGAKLRDHVDALTAYFKF